MDHAAARTLANPLHGLLDQWSVAMLAGTIVWTRALGADAIATFRARRCADLLEHAREQSPYCRHAWRHCGDATPGFATLPVTHKAALMESFDTWCTDRAITRRAVDPFLAGRVHIGERFLDRYVVWTSSGTTGTPGIFVQDGAALTAYDALVGVPLMSGGVMAYDWTAAAHGGRAALVTADCGHFAGIASWRRLAQGHPWLDMRSFPVTMPLPQLVAELADYAPAYLASYPTVLAMLAAEQAAGRLDLHPVALWSGGEVLTRAAQRAIESAFGCPLHNEYGASECLAMGYGCTAGAVHVNADWVILEPVERDYRPTPDGELSHTVLVTNLANFVQPIVRYDLGDRVRMLAGPCACGSPLPALHVEGRCDDVVTLHAEGGRSVALPPLALTTVIEESAHVHRFQVVQTAPDALALRLPGGERDAADAALAALRDYLDCQGLPAVSLRLAAEEPQAGARDGKLRQVLALGRRHP